MPLLMKTMRTMATRKPVAPSFTTNFHLLLPYAAPYVIYVALGNLQGLLSIEWIYTLRLIGVPALLIWAWRWYLPIGGPKNRWGSMAMGIWVGLVGTVIWIVLLSPFAGGKAPAWSRQAFYLRMAASTLVVPVFEEFMMRGYVYRLVFQWRLERKKGTPDAFNKTLSELTICDIDTISWSAPAVLISTALFALGHQMAEWPAAVAYGFLMVGLLVVRRDLLSCIAAHATTNFCLAMYIYSTGYWQYW